MATQREIERLLADMRRILHTRSYSPRTRDTYVRWAERFLKATPTSPSADSVEPTWNAFSTA